MKAWRRAADLQRQSGFDALHVSQIGLGCAEDAEILEAARLANRVCVTLDHDFHAHLAESGQGRPSVVLLRLQGLGAKDQAELIRSVCMQCEDALRQGAAISADAEVLRIRRLPLK